MRKLIFATGIECSYPTIKGGHRRDQLAETRHYEHWRLDLELCLKVGATVVRYGPPYYRMHLGPDRYDWSFTDEVLPAMREMGLIPIIDLCHFGVPDWVGDFQNDDWPELFAAYSEAFAARYPWISLYTPVNEIYVCARFSAQDGIWNEQLSSPQAMIKSHGVQCKATLLSIEAIRRVTPHAVFFQSEACEEFLETHPDTRQEVELLNAMRFITFDFLYGHPPDGHLLDYMYELGVTREQFHWFMEHGRMAAPHCVMGMDYYGGHEQTVDSSGANSSIGPTLGWANIARRYYHRYRKPLMLTETNTGKAEDGPDWLWKTWHNLTLLRSEGVPVIGYTWFSLQNQVDWDIRLQEVRGNEVGNGLFKLDRTPNPAAGAFRELCSRYQDEPLLPDFAMGQLIEGGSTTAIERLT